MDWITDINNPEDAPVNNNMYIVTIDNGECRYIDYIEFYWGEWCVNEKNEKVIAWASVEPYKGC